jgi:hypothetical protein
MNLREKAVGHRETQEDAKREGVGTDSAFTCQGREADHPSFVFALLLIRVIHFREDF